MPSGALTCDRIRCRQDTDRTGCSRILRIGTIDHHTFCYLWLEVKVNLKLLFLYDKIDFQFFINNWVKFYRRHHRGKTNWLFSCLISSQQASAIIRFSQANKSTHSIFLPVYSLPIVHQKPSFNKAYSISIIIQYSQNKWHHWLNQCKFWNSQSTNNQAKSIG